MQKLLVTSLGTIGFFDFQETFGDSLGLYSLAASVSIEQFSESFETGVFRDLLFGIPWLSLFYSIERVL